MFKLPEVVVNILVKGTGTSPKLPELVIFEALYHSAIFCAMTVLSSLLNSL
jgi:hypothetical protein